MLCKFIGSVLILKTLNPFATHIFAVKITNKDKINMAKADNQQVMSARDKALERMRTRYPDKEFADDEALFGQISDDYDEYDNQLSTYKEREGKFMDMFTRDPRSAHFITAWRDGEDPVVGLVRQFGTDIKEAIDDPARQEEIAAANKEFVDRVAAEKELEETYQANIAESLRQLEQYQSANGLSDDEVDKIMSYLVGIIGDGIMGKFTSETIDMARKALNHDADVSVAQQEGEVRGKNAQIEEKLRTRNAGDGTVDLAGKNGGTRTPKRSIFDDARGAM